MLDAFIHLYECVHPCETVASHVASMVSVPIYRRNYALVEARSIYLNTTCSACKPYIFFLVQTSETVITIVIFTIWVWEFLALGLSCNLHNKCYTHFFHQESGVNSYSPATVSVPEWACSCVRPWTWTNQSTWAQAVKACYEVHSPNDW